MTLIADVPVWSEKCYIRPIRTAPDGATGFTHLASLRPPQGPDCRGYVKHFAENAEKGLFNEWFGYIVMRALGVPQPPAAFMRAPVFGLEGAPARWAFVSCEPSPTFDGTPKQLYNFKDPEQYAQLVQRLFSCTAIPLLIAADQLLANTDRNIGNLVFTGKSSFVAIDHSDILGGCNWALSDLYFTQKWAKSKLIESLVTLDQVKPATRGAIYACAQLVGEQFYAAGPELRLLMNNKEKQDVAAALDAVWWRADPVAEWFKEKLEFLL